MNDLDLELVDLIESVLAQIKSDVEVGDFTAIEELIVHVPKQYLRAYLPEESQ